MMAKTYGWAGRSERMSWGVPNTIDCKAHTCRLFERDVTNAATRAMYLFARKCHESRFPIHAWRMRMLLCLNLSSVPTRNDAAALTRHILCHIDRMQNASARTRYHNCPPCITALNTIAHRGRRCEPGSARHPSCWVAIPDGALRVINTWYQFSLASELISFLTSLIVFRDPYRPFIHICSSCHPQSQKN